MKLVEEGSPRLDVGINETEQLAVVSFAAHGVEGDAVRDHGRGRHVKNLENAIAMLTGDLLDLRPRLGCTPVGHQSELRVALRDRAGDEEPQVLKGVSGHHHVEGHLHRRSHAATSFATRRRSRGAGGARS